MAKVDRAGVGGILLPDETSETLLRGAAETSLVQRYARSIPMQAQNKVITEAEVSGANVFWVGEGARKSTDGPTMTSKSWTMSAAELAVIIPLDENVADDATIDLFDLYKPAIETAIAQAFDAAALTGTAKPTAWGTLGTDIIPNALVAGHGFEEALAPVDADTELLNLISGTGAVPGTPDGALQALEEDGYEPNGSVGYVRFKSRLRGLKDADNRYVFGDAIEAGVPGSLFGVPISFATSDVWPTTGANESHLVMGDWSKAIVGTRQGIRYKTFDQGVITDGAGAVTYSLMENDMIALRVTARYGFKVIADDTADGEVLAVNEPFPFAAVQPYIA